MQQWIAQVMELHAHTPILSVIEPRGLIVRSVGFLRAHADELTDERVDRFTFDLCARRVDRWDPRLWALTHQAPGTPSNVKSVHSLSGQELFSDSVDAGWRAQLLRDLGDSQLYWDAKGQARRFNYDDCGRPITVFESDGVGEYCVERLTYGGPDDASNNLSGQLIRHDDPAGSLLNMQYGLTSKVLQQSRRILKEPFVPDESEIEAEREGLLESGDGAVTRWQFGALGDELEQTDAAGNVQLFAQTVCGQLKAARIQLKDQTEQTLVSDIRYDVQNRIESQTLGNGLITTLEYDAADGRLANLRTDGGRLQNLSYSYDPVGNVVSIEDRAQPTRYFANQQIEPLRTFAYDTLYQLIEATGYEASSLSRGPGSYQPFTNATELGNYTQRYEYDAGGNLQKLVHSGAQNYTRVFATAMHSNRTLLQTGQQPPTEQQIAAAFDANGNLRELAPGQSLSWDLRNQLSEVTPVERDSGIDDREVYVYDAQGMRVRKVRIAQAKATTHISDVRYLPGLEIRTNSATGEELHVVVATAGRSDVRVLHWQAGRPSEIANDQIRYSLTDHLGSSTLELDTIGQLISHEVYYPYGETAWFAARNEVEAGFKTVRYSGKERDATGLYYYGLRYYAPSFLRWLNPDPAGVLFGINPYIFVKNRPVSFADFLGLAPIEVVATGISNFPGKSQQKMRSVLDLSRQMLESVVFQLQAGPLTANIESALNISFGLDREADFEGYLRERLSKINEFLRRLDGDQEGRLLLAKLPIGVRGETSDAKAAGDRTITLSQCLLDKSHPLYVAKTLIHEASHAVHHTRDFGYLDTGVKSPKDRATSVGDYVRKLESSSVSLRSTGFLEQDMEVWDLVHYARLMKTFGVSSDDAEARAQHFKGNTRARNAVMVHNADSLATFAVIAWHGEQTLKASPGDQSNVSSQPRPWAQRLRALFR